MGFMKINVKTYENDLLQKLELKKKINACL